MKSDHDEQYNEFWLTNRQKKRQFKAGFYWCGGCDRNLVGDWHKCEVCGKRNGAIRNRKNDN